MGLTSILKHVGEIMLGDFKTTLVDRLSRVETKIDSMERNIDRIEGDMNEIRTEVKGLGYRTNRLEAVTQEIQSFLKKAGAPLHQPPLIGTGSPLKLLEAGEELAQKIHGYDFIAKNEEFFFELIRKINPTSKYDVQEAANTVLRESIHHPILKPIKDFAYESGTKIEDPISVLGIILRDAFLRKNQIE